MYMSRIIQLGNIAAVMLRITILPRPCRERCLVVDIGAKRYRDGGTLFVVEVD